MTKRICATLQDDLWKTAVFNDIGWSRALKIGIETLAQIGAEERVIEQITETKKRLEWLEHHHENMIQEKAKKDAARREWLQLAAAIPKPLEVRVRQYNVKFGENITMKELEDLIKHERKKTGKPGDTSCNL